MRNSEVAVRLLGKLSWLVLPFLVYVLAVRMIDPFNFFGRDGLISDTIKAEYASKLNTPLYLLVKYKKSPAKNILLGDSRMGLMNPDAISHEKQEEYFNLSYGASTITEIVSTFWQVTEWQTPSAIYIGLSLDLYNQMNNRNRVTGVTGMMKNPLLYFSNYNVLEGMFLVTKATISKQVKPIDLPGMSRAEFWNYQINTTGCRYFSNYIYPAEYFTELKKISQYCREHNSRLVFVVFPTHTDLQQLIDQYNLRPAESRFLSDISALAEVYNFNIVSELTTDKENFNDPFHAKSDVIKKVAEIIFDKADSSGSATPPLFIHTMPGKGQQRL